MFYFTYLTGGVPQPNAWREFYFLVTLKGLSHNNSHINITKELTNNTNTTILHSGQYLDTVYSTGTETVGNNEEGYNEFGQKGTNDWWLIGPWKHKYKHRFKHLWVDIVVIKRNVIQPVPLPCGSYITHFTVRSSHGALLPFTLYGENTEGGTTHNYLFTIESVVPTPFPYENLANKNSVADALHVGKASYFSVLSDANLRLASDAAGSAVDFKLYSAGVPPIPFGVVFNCTTPATGPTHITSPALTFNSVSASKVSPIDGNTSIANVIEGDIKIFVPANTMPMSGTYSSTIYCILTQQ